MKNDHLILNLLIKSKKIRILIMTLKKNKAGLVTLPDITI